MRVLPSATARGLSRSIAQMMTFFNRRLVALAKKKLAAGAYGDRNANWSLLVGGFLPDGTSGKLLAHAFWRLLKLEVRCLFLKQREGVSMPELPASIAVKSDRALVEH